jgi:hypothetical protein
MDDGFFGSQLSDFGSRFTVFGFSALLLLFSFILHLRHRYVSSHTGAFNKRQAFCMMEVRFLNLL